MAIPTMIVGPVPKRRAAGPASMAPTSELMPPSPKITPSTAGSKSSPRVTKIMYVAKNMPVPAALNGSAIASARSLGSRATARSPSFASAQTPVRVSGGGGAGSGARIERKKSAEKTKEIASHEHGDRPAEHLHEPAGDAEAGELRHARGRRELAVALDQLVARDERRQVRLVRHVEEDRQRCRAQRDGVQLSDRERVERVGDRDRREQRRSSEIGGDHHRATAQPVDPDARRNARRRAPARGSRPRVAPPRAATRRARGSR